MRMETALDARAAECGGSAPGGAKASQGTRAASRRSGPALIDTGGATAAGNGAARGCSGACPPSANFKVRRCGVQRAPFFGRPAARAGGARRVVPLAGEPSGQQQVACPSAGRPASTVGALRLAWAPSEQKPCAGRGEVRAAPVAAAARGARHALCARKGLAAGMRRGAGGARLARGSRGCTRQTQRLRCRRSAGGEAAQRGRHAPRVVCVCVVRAVRRVRLAFVLGAPALALVRVSSECECARGTRRRWRRRSGEDVVDAKDVLARAARGVRGAAQGTLQEMELGAADAGRGRSEVSGTGGLPAGR